MLIIYLGSLSKIQLMAIICGENTQTFSSKSIGNYNYHKLQTSNCNKTIGRYCYQSQDFKPCC